MLCSTIIDIIILHRDYKINVKCYSPPPLLLITVYWSHSDLPYICSTIITRILCWLPFFFESLSFPLSISLYLFLHVSFFPNLTLSLSTYLPSFPLLNHFQSINMHISIFILFSLCSWLSSFLSLFYSLLFRSVSVLFLFCSWYLVVEDSSRMNSGNAHHTPIYSTNGPASNAKHIAQSNVDQISNKNQNKSFSTAAASTSTLNNLNININQANSYKLADTSNLYGQQNKPSSWLPENPNQHPGRYCSHSKITENQRARISSTLCFMIHFFYLLYHSWYIQNFRCKIMFLMLVSACNVRTCLHYMPAIRSSLSIHLLYLMLCYLMLSFVLLSYVILRYTILCYAMLLYLMPHDIMLCHVMLCCFMLCYVILCYFMSYYVMLCCVDDSNIVSVSISPKYPVTG